MLGFQALGPRKKEQTLNATMARRSACTVQDGSLYGKISAPILQVETMIPRTVSVSGSTRISSTRPTQDDPALR
jgi:hypothetical protein